METPAKTAQSWRFGVFEVDARNMELRRGGTAVKIREQSFSILVFLLEHAGELVTREDLRRVLWPSDTFVDFDHSLNAAVMKLREALGDSADAPLYIETIPKRGYRFIAPVSQLPSLLNRSSPAHEQNEQSLGRNGISRPAVSFRVALVGSGLVLLILVAVIVVYHATSSSKVASGLHSVPLTTVEGNVWDPAFSPDAKQIAFMWDGENPVKGDLYVQLVGSEKPLRLTHTKSGYLCCADWSPGGREIAFGRCDDSGGGVYVVPALGGLERKLTDVFCQFADPGQPVWTADGNSLVLLDSCVPGGPRGIVLFSLGTGEKRCLTAPPPHGDVGDAAPALSPDGKTVAFRRSSTFAYDEIYTITLSGKNLRQLTHDGGHPIGRHLIWTPDAHYIVFNSDRSGVKQPWRVPVDGGAIESETGFPDVGSLTPDGRRLAYVQDSGLPPAAWRAELASTGGKVLSLRKIVVSSRDNDAMQLTPDGQQMVFRSNRAGRWDIWKGNADGSNQQPLTSFDRGWAGTPRWSPDGNWIVFDFRNGPHSQIKLVDSEGRNQHSVVSGDYENVVPSFSRDGTAIHFASNRTGDWQAWKHELATGRETQVTYHGGYAAFESYDAKTLYYSKREGGGIWSMPAGGGAEERITDALHRGYWGHFAVTDAGIYFLDADASPRPTIMYYSFQTHQLTPVLQLEERPRPFVANLSASRDGRTLLFTQWVPQSSIMMAENLQ